ncbi:MAG: AAA family ATPase, partial [Prevotellamassilia sp.]|nr:AAA family ATPase [Prevotellamassilia sp.]
MKYPIGIQTFEKIIKEGYVYVDKTDMVYALATEGTTYFLSRPRRFGKSLLLSTLRAYFEGKKELFKGLKIDKLEKDWHVHRVFHFDFNSVNFTQPNALEETLDYELSQWEKEYGIEAEFRNQFGLRLEKILQVAAKQTGHGAVVLIDEYDKPLLDVLEVNPELLNNNREILKGFYSTFKKADAYLRFVFLTGVTKFSQVSVFSGFNQPLDISMAEKFEALCGITEEELHTQFAEPIREMAQAEDCTEEDLKQRLKKQYDGYHFSKQMTDIYNPFSILNAFYNKDIRDFWFATGTPTYLIRLMNHFNEGIDELTGREYSLDEFVNYKADTEYPLPMIYQSGYLTIKNYDREMDMFLLDFPNNEVKRGFLAMVASNYLQSGQPMDSWIKRAVLSLRRGQIDQFRQML